MKIVQLEANDDPVTARVHASRRKALAALDRGGHTLHQLFGPSATGDALQVAYYAVSGTLDFISGMGHGDDTEFTGQGQTVVLSTRMVRSATQSAIIHLYSCNTANQLGPYLVAQGKAKAYIGYKTFVQVGRTAGLSDIFVEEAAAIDLAISAGRNAAQTKTAADAAYDASHRKLENSVEATPRDLAAFELNHDNMVGPWTNSAQFGSF
jgi:hypothetical protein